MKEAVAPPWSHSMNNKVKALITNLKHLPGVYLMHNAKDEIIYIGKAKDLYNRVSQYFLRPQAGKVAKMVFDVDYFETIITKTEKEALILEMNLIQTHYPKYNILLKDDSHYPYIALHKKGDPFLTIKRNNKDRNYDYFGPFPSGKSARGTIELLNKIFPLRKCSPLKKEPCLYYHLGQCLAPCIKPVDSDVYETIVEQIKRFFKGDSATIKKEYEKKMLDASSEQKYELAAEYKKIVDYIEHISTAQNVESNDHKDYDVFAYATRDNYLALSVIVYRDGMVLGKNSFVVERFDVLSEQVQDLILQYYQKHTPPVEIVINDENVIALLNDYLDSRIESVTRGHRFELVSMALENAQNALDEYYLSPRIDENKIALLEELGHILNIDTPLRIELFDNSHLQGSNPVGAVVTFINGEPVKSLYRKYHIEWSEGKDDLKSMKEVVWRRYKRMKEENKSFPSLILLDGGLNQINAAKEALNDLDVSIPVYGLYKNDKHQTEGIIDEYGQKYKIENKSLFFMLTRMQDEVHRFAISFHRSLRDKSFKNSILDGIKGLGEKRKEIILRNYQDIKTLKNASVEELNQFLPVDVALSLYQSLHNDDENN